MSSDRLARMKAERDAARGIVPQQQQQSQQQSPIQQEQQQQGYGQQYPTSPQQSYGGGPQMHPIQQEQQYNQQQPVNTAAYDNQPGYNNQQQQQGYPQQDAPLAGPGGYQEGGVGAGFANGGTAAPGDMNAFFGEIDNIGGQLQQLKNNIAQINTLHNAVLNSTINEQKQEQAQNELTQLTGQTSRLTNDIKLRIKNLSEQNDKIPALPGNESERNTRRLQVAAQKKKFMDLIQEYREVEKKSRDRYRARMERQYKIVKPDATEAEIKQAIETDQGTQVFANALTQSTRYADARNAYREVQERHEDIKRIAQTMTELQELFNDMAMLVERQDESIVAIEASAQDVENNMEAGNKEIVKGQIKAKKARRKRVWCFWILVIIIIAIVLAVVLSVLSKNGTI